MTDPDPGGPKTYGSGSTTQLPTLTRQDFVLIFVKYGLAPVPDLDPEPEP